MTTTALKNRSADVLNSADPDAPIARPPVGVGLGGAVRVCGEVVWVVDEVGRW
jgi:hypothetical protein